MPSWGRRCLQRKQWENKKYCVSHRKTQYQEVRAESIKGAHSVAPRPWSAPSKVDWWHRNSSRFGEKWHRLRSIPRYVPPSVAVVVDRCERKNELLPELVSKKISRSDHCWGDVIVSGRLNGVRNTASPFAVVRAVSTLTTNRVDSCRSSEPRFMSAKIAPVPPRIRFHGCTLPMPRAKLAS